MAGYIVRRDFGRVMRPLGPRRALIVAAALLAACGGGTNQTEMEREIQNALSSDLAPIPVAAVDCPEDVVLDPESVFPCSAEVDGSYFEVQVTILDAQGRWEYERRHAILNVVNTELILQNDLSVALGFDVTADCGDSENLVVSVGNTFLCRLSRVNGGAIRDIEVQVKSADQAIEWSLMPSVG